MLVGTNYYITHSYNEDKFQLLLEKQLARRKGSQLSPELIEQSIAAYLACADENASFPADYNDVQKMEKLLELLDLTYSDFRSYGADKVKGNPEEAIRVFNELAFDLARTTPEERQ